MQIESLEELRVFTQIVESGSISAAARALSMPSNTVGRRLASLEERVGTKLLYRTTRSQSLSEAGRTLLTRAQRILAEVQAAEVALQREAEGLAGVVRLSVPSVLTADLFAALQPLLDAHPALRLQVEVNDRPVSPVAAGLDVVILGGRWNDSSLIARKLADVQLVPLAARSYLEANGTPTTPEDLGNHRTLHFRTPSPQTAWTLTDAAGGEHTVPVQARVEVDDGRGLFDALVAGLGVAMLSTRVARSAPTVQRILPGFRGARIPIYAVYPVSGQRSARLQVVVETLQQTLSAESD